MSEGLKASEDRHKTDEAYCTQRIKVQKIDGDEVMFHLSRNDSRSLFIALSRTSFYLALVFVEKE